jgi:hypothetical protein
MLTPANEPLADMEMEGELERLLADVIPHEVTHCVLADHFRCPLPRWADEGISLMSESEEERSRHLKVARDTANAGKFIQIRALFASREYPKEVMGFFAQSYWVTKFLVEKKDRATFVTFVTDGMKDWQIAAEKHYGFASLNDLETEFLKSLKLASRSDGTPSVLPVFSSASADESGSIVISVPILAYRLVTSYSQRQSTHVLDGKQMEKNYFEPRTSYQVYLEKYEAHRYATGIVKAFRPDGTPIDERSLVAALLNKTTPVIVSTTGGMIDKTFATMLKSDAIILAVPAGSISPPPTAPPMSPSPHRP